MILYIIIALWPLIMLYSYRVSGNNSIENKNRFLYLSAIPMFTILAIRGEYMGADTYIYAKHFLEVQNLPLNIAIEDTRMEVGYVIFVKYLGYLTTDPKIYQMTCVTIYFICFMSFAKQLEKTDGFMFFFLVCTLGLFMFMFTGVRQCISMSICLSSYKYLLRRKYIICLVLVLIAFTFHKSSLLFLFALFIWHRKVTFKNLFVYIIILYLVSFYLFEAQMFLNEQFDYNYEIEETSSGGLFLTLILIFTFLSWFVLKKNKSISIYEKGLFNVNIITIFFWFLRLQTRVAERPSYYFLAFSCVLFAHIINKLPQNLSIIRPMIILLCLSLYIYRLLTNYSSILSYQTFF